MKSKKAITQAKAANGRHESRGEAARVIETSDLTLLQKSAHERFLTGQRQRKQMRRVDHAVWNEKLRETTPEALLKASVAGRVPELIKLKNKLMAGSAFSYFRGAVPVMAYDLSRLPNTGILTQLCGDAHVRNLGAFAAEDGRITFDINDFDESIAGPFEWDVKRLATSLILAGREAGSTTKQCREAVAAFVALYRGMMRTFAGMPVLAVARYEVRRLKSVTPLRGILRAAQRSTPARILEAMTEEAKAAPGHAVGRTLGHGARIFKSQPPTLERITGAEAQRVVDALKPYTQSLLPERRRFFAQYAALDVAFKVVGTGSVGLRDYVVYMEGNGANDPLFVQIKEEVASAWAPYLPDAIHARHEGQRVVEGERAMQLQSDPLLGWTSMVDEKGVSRDYIVRQLNDHKGSVDVTVLKSTELMDYAAVCGEMLARGHARGGDCCVLAGYIGSSAHFDDAILSFAEAYADQTEKDWKGFVKGLKGSR